MKETETRKAMVPVRFRPTEVLALEKLAYRLHTGRSELVRCLIAEALADSALMERVRTKLLEAHEARLNRF